MRKDLQHKLLEGRARSKDRERNPRIRINTQHIDEDKDYKDTPRKRQFYDPAWPNYHLLGRILKSNVGRVWNEVFSELCEQLDSRKYADNVIRDAIQFFVDTHAYISEGYVWCHYRDLYVDPQDGVLRRHVQKRFKYTPEVDPNLVNLDALRRLVRVKGIWYLETCKEVPEMHWRKVGLDYVKVPTGRMTLVPDTKKQLSRAELGSYHLRNTPEITAVSRKTLKRIA